MVVGEHLLQKRQQPRRELIGAPVGLPKDLAVVIVVLLLIDVLLLLVLLGNLYRFVLIWMACIMQAEASEPKQNAPATASAESSGPMVVGEHLLQKRQQPQRDWARKRS